MLTGILGSNYFRFGSIIFGGVGGPSKLDFQVHVLTATKIRIKFNSKMIDSALELTNYMLSSIIIPVVIPTITSIEYYDETHRSVVLNLSQSLTTTAEYTVTISNIYDEGGESLLNAPNNFIANVADPAIAIGAYQSRSGCVDVIFDKNVGPLSDAGPVFSIRDASVLAPSFVMPATIWADELIPENTIRIELPGTTPAADAYSIDFVDVCDSSYNLSSGTTPLTLVLRSPLPYDLTKLSQIQLTDAFITDVNRGFYDCVTIRVFFNTSTQFLDQFTNVGDPANWGVFQQGSHLTEDTTQITTVNDFTLPTLIILTNELRSKFNAHIMSIVFHKNTDSNDLLTSPIATDLDSVVALLNEMHIKYNAHVINEQLHLYEDTTNTIFAFVIDPSIPFFAFTGSIYVSDLLKAAYNFHVAAEFELQIQGYSNPVGDITNFSYKTAFNVESPFTYSVDLHVNSTSINTSFRVEAMIISDDGLTTTNPADYTGSIQVKPLINNNLSSIVVNSDGWVELSFNEEVSIPLLDSISVITNNTKIPIELIKLSASFPSLIWAFNNMVNSYTRHLSSFTGDTHQYTDNDNIINGEFASNNLSATIINANTVKQILTNHMMSDTFHFQSDYDIPIAADATDYDSLVILIDDLRRSFLSHSQKLGPHSVIGYRMFSTPFLDKIKLKIKNMKNEVTYQINGKLNHPYYVLGIPSIADPKPLGETVVNEFEFQSEFIGLSTKPSLASAIPTLALEDTDAGPTLRSDRIELYFSKPMLPSDLNSGNITIAGGLIQKESRWIDKQTVSVQVMAMSQIPYTITVVGLTDESGNSVY